MLKNNERPVYYADVETCVENTLSKVGKRIVLGIPLGLGKPNQLVNEFFRRACKDPSLQLKIFTGLTLARPRWKNEFERRLLEPLTARIFGNYPEIDYVSALKKNKLPANIEISEFYFQPGQFLYSGHAQRSYISSNYTHVIRDSLDKGINVFAQLISSAQSGDQTHYSLSCNADLTPDLIPKMRAQERKGKAIAILGQVNPELPFMYGDALVSPEDFDAIIENPRYTFKLFSPPNKVVSPVDYMIGLHASTLVKDGGTIQLGIGSLSDAITYLIGLRHQHNAAYRSLLAKFNILNRFTEVIEEVGGIHPFKEGLYAVSEMFVDGFRELYRRGVLKRKVYPNKEIQRLLNKKSLSERISPETLSRLLEKGIIHPKLTQKDITLLQTSGIFKAGLKYHKGLICLDNGIEIPADLSDTHTAEKIYNFCLGTHLKGGQLLHASFFLGSQRFYNFLRDLGETERKQFAMKRISYVNELYGDEELKRLQRKEARFLDSALMATLTGAIISDKLKDGRTVSGVGGQYNFIAMAHALSDGRAIIMLRSVRKKHGKLHSNILWNYGHITIPNHLRDIVVTEYGIADLRGKNDQEIIIALLKIADSRFQDSLLKKAKRTGKISKYYQLPDEFKNNYPEHFTKQINAYKTQGLFPEFPLGTELTQEEVALMKTLELLQTMVIKKKFPIPSYHQLTAIINKPESAIPYLKRLNLDSPKTVKEKLMQKFLLYGLSQIGAI